MTNSNPEHNPEDASNTQGEHQMGAEGEKLNLDPLAPTPLEEENAEAESAETLDPAQAKAIIEALQNELATTKDQAVRAIAEAENTRRRAQKEREDASKFAIASFAKDLLEISDTLRRAIEATPSDLIDSEPRVKSFIEGVEATERVLLKAFEKHGISKIEPLDEPFNPNFHEVMFETPVPGKPGGIVMQVLEPGYVINERLLRAAKVGVTKDDGSTPPPSQGGTIDTEA